MSETQAKNSTPTSAPRLVELAPLEPSASSMNGAALPNLDLLRGVRVNLQVRAGHSVATVGTLLELKRTSILKLEQAVDAPVEVLLEGQVVARGELVAVDGNFGVRITEVATLTR